MPRQPGWTPPRRPLSLHERHYRLLEEILGQPLPDLRSGVVYRLRAEGFMDLVAEVLSRDRGTGATVLSLAHYFTQHGDLCQDPEMEVRVYPPREGQPGLVEALSFQQSTPPIYQRVYPEPGMVNPGLQRELNSFLGTWLRNLKAQGHRLVRRTDSRSPGRSGSRPPAPATSSIVLATGTVDQRIGIVYDHAHRDLLTYDVHPEEGVWLTSPESSAYWSTPTIPKTSSMTISNGVECTRRKGHIP